MQAPGRDCVPFSKEVVQLLWLSRSKFAALHPLELQLQKGALVPTFDDCVVWSGCASEF